MKLAYRLGQDAFRDRPKELGRKGHTLAQMFACLVVREMLHLSYRRTEALLGDSPLWLADIGLARAPDHNTLWRAFGYLCTTQRLHRMLDLLAQLFEARHLLQLRQKPLAVDSTCYEQRHRSRHYDRRCRRMGLAPGGKYRASAGKTKRSKPSKRSADAARRREHRRMPKLALACASSCHVILAAKARTGSGSDAPDLIPLLRQARQRVHHGPVSVVVADAGYDSEENHRTARTELAMRTIIPPTAGRPGRQPPAGYWRRHMRQRFARQADRPRYRHRAQIETVHSMMKRNMGDELRSRLKPRRKREMLLRTVVHDIMLAAALEQL
jgi:hypothetical protein